MSDAIVKADPKEHWVQSFLRRAKGDVVKTAEATGVAPYGKQLGSTALEIGEGFVIGSVLGAAKARFGVDASPALMGAAGLAAVMLAGNPEAAGHARAVAGQAAAVMMDRRSQNFLGGGGSRPAPASTTIRTVGGGSAKISGEDIENDPVLRAAAVRKLHDR